MRVTTTGFLAAIESERVDVSTIGVPDRYLAGSLTVTVATPWGDLRIPYDALTSVSVGDWLTVSVTVEVQS